MADKEYLHMDILDPKVLAIVLAGGKGSRLMPLTSHRAKPAVPFGAYHRIIDFVLSNLVNGGYDDILVITQYRSKGLDGYLRTAWDGGLSAGPVPGRRVRVTPLPSRQAPGGNGGSADALHRNLDAIESCAPEHVLLFGADHVYRMDPRQMLAQHVAHGAGVTVAAVRQPIALADQFGVIDAASDGRRIEAFREKPADAAGLPDAPDQVYASMGNYAWRTDALLAALRADAADPASAHDVGGNLIPAMVAQGSAGVYDFTGNRIPGTSRRGYGYWRDVGTLDAYHEAHMDVLGADPLFDLANPHWPIGAPGALRPAPSREAGPGSVVGPGVMIAGSVHRSVLSSGVRVDRSAQVDSCVLMDDVHVGAGCVIRNAVVDQGVTLAPGTRIGLDAEADRARYTVTEGGVVIVGRPALPGSSPILQSAQLAGV
jgi:glucose-1-phosphate adenylyltransferase